MTKIFLAFAIILFFGCNSNDQRNIPSVSKTPNTKADTARIDSSFLKEILQAKDTVYNEQLAERLKPIRENFKRINSITKWTSRIKKELDESIEGGDAIFFYSNGILEKIVTQLFGETYQQSTAYYLSKGQLSFVFEKLHKYNRPIYYDSILMRENNDNEAFDFEKSTIIEERSYFENGKLIHRVNNQGDRSPFTKDNLLDQEKRILTVFKKLKAIERSS